MLFTSSVCHAFASVHCCLVVTCLERADLLSVVSDVNVTFPCAFLGNVCYLIVSIPDLCHLSYFVILYPIILYKGHRLQVYWCNYEILFICIPSKSTYM